MPAPTATDEFLRMVRQSQLIPEGELDAYLRRRDGSLPPSLNDLATVLVRDGILTGFQAQQLLKGKWRGFVIAGKYKLLEYLGSGGMAMVFLCEHVAMQRRVALKVLPASQAKDPGAIERFYREARAVAALDHPNIVRAYDIDHDGKIYFLVMEYIDGPSLADIVRKRGPLLVARAINYIRQAAVGLHHAHLAGLVHRDVKPGNILVDRTGIVKVLDLGLARFFHDRIDDITRRFDDSAALGTVDYLAPEQALDSHGADIRADIYSLGATLYAVLTARTPFGPGTAMEKMMRHQTKEPEPLQNLRPDVPAGLAASVAKMMAKSPAERYQTPAEVEQALLPWDSQPLHLPAADEVPAWSPRATGPGSSTRSLVFGPTSSPLVPTVPEADPTTSPGVPTAPAPVKPRAGHDWRGWAIKAAGAVTFLGLALLGVYWAQSARKNIVTHGGGPVDSVGNPIATDPVTISQEGGRRRVLSKHYEAVIEKDGNFVSLKSGDAELFKTGVPWPPGQPSRGAYLYSEAGKRVLTFAKVTNDQSVVSASSDQAAFVASFGPKSVVWSITNLSSDDLYFCILFDPSVTAVRNGMAEWSRVPLPLPQNAPAGSRFALNWDPTWWFVGRSRLMLRGEGTTTETWALAPSPKQSYQVWQLRVTPGKTRKVSARIDEATPQELAEVAKVSAASR